MSKVEYIKKACNYADSLFKDIINNFNFKTEKDLASHIKKFAKKNKLKLAFSPIVGAGRNGAEIHHKPKDVKLMGFVVVDYGFKYKGYCCDITRTVFVGKPNKKQKELYDKVKKVQISSIKNIKKGVCYKDLDLKARKKFNGLKRNFVHALGHGVGKKVHQFPKISPKSKWVAKIGDIIAIEPGLYFKNRFGIRIEDTVLVGKSKADVLTKASKKLIIIKA